MARYLNNLVIALQACQHVDQGKVRLHGRARQIVETTHLGQRTLKVLLLGVKAADLVLGKIQRIGSAKDTHGTVLLHHRQHHAHQLVVAELGLHRARRQKLSNSTLGFQLLDKARKALESTSSVNFGLLAQLDDAGDIRIVVLLHDLKLVSRISEQ